VQHSVLEHGAEGFLCPDCKLVFSGAGPLSVHMLAHRGGGRLAEREMAMACLRLQVQ
jgi:hypothetical protein